MYYLYILKSKEGNHTYLGVTSDFQSRLKKHNSGGNRSTKAYRPWKIIYIEEFDSKQEALIREKMLKSPQGYTEKRAILKQLLSESNNSRRRSRIVV